MLEGSISLKHIYKSTKVLPYVYICKEKNGPNFYIGYRWANYVPSTEDFGIYYFTSNDYVKNNFDQFDYFIVAEFYSKDDAYAFENQLIKESKSEHCLNYKKYKKFKEYEKINVDNSPKKCALPGCGKMHTNWRMKCCCSSHGKQYAGRRSHQNR